MEIELINCTDTLLDLVASKDSKRDDIAKFYYWALRSSEETDWKKVNEAIIKRWSHSALTYIKTLAWKKLERESK